MSSPPSRDYLSEYDAASADDKFPLIKKWMHSEPLALFKQLRERRPVLVTPECTLVTLFADVRDMLQMPKVFTVDLYKPKMGVTDTEEGYLMAHDDDALHYREKSIMQDMLNRDDLPRVRALVGDAGKEVLDSAGGEIEIVNKYCRVVPAVLVQEYFGLDGVDKAELIEWSYWNQYDAFHNQPFDLNSPEKFQEIVSQREAVGKKLGEYMAMLIGRKIIAVKAKQAKNILLIGWYAAKALIGRLFGKKPEPAKDDIVSRMLASTFAKEVDFSLLRLGANAGGLLIGAIETTSQAVSQVIEFLIERPDLMARAQSAAKRDDPAEFDSMVWEALRFVPISPYLFRTASQDYTIAKGTERETTVSAGTNVLAITQSAMFDSYAFEDPDTFNPNRNWYHHFNFGFASHECLGKYVGMVMIPEMVRQVVLKNVRAETKIDYKGTPFPEAYTLRWG